jgi:cell division transport system permease protein
MIFLSCITLVIAINLNNFISRKNIEYKTSFIVQIPGGDNQRQETDKVFGFLKSQDFITEVIEIRPGKIKELIEPWLGSGEVINSLPIPVILEARTKEDLEINYPELGSRLRLIAPSAEIGYNHEWMESLNGLTRSAQALGGLIIVLIGLITFAMIVLATRTGLKLHGNSINILNFIGATDEYVAHQFQANSAILALKGSVLGVMLSIPALLPLSLIAEQMEWVKFSLFNLGFVHILSFAVVIAITVVLAYYLSRQTVMSILATR